MSRKDILKIALIAAVLAAAVLLVTHIGGRQKGAEAEVVTRAIRDAAVTCYAVEGAYPKDLAYLREHYQLAYDEDRYVVFYDRDLGSNILPTIVVRERGSGAP
jgi:hypothetical protein